VAESVGGSLDEQINQFSGRRAALTGGASGGVRTDRTVAAKLIGADD
jgi:hypothetical protein